MESATGNARFLNTMITQKALAGYNKLYLYKN